MHALRSIKMVLMGQLPLFLLLAGCGQSSLTEVHQLTALQARLLTMHNAGNTDFVILDIRTPKEFRRGHIKGAVLLDYHHAQFINSLQRLDKSKVYFIYCHTGYRSSRTIRMVKKMGFSTIYHLKRGIVEWHAHRLPIATP